MSTAVAFEQELNDVLLQSAKRRNAPGGRFDRMMNGEIPYDSHRVGVVQFFFHTLGFTNALRHLYARCDIPEIRGDIAEGLYEEETGAITGTAPHIELYYRMAEAYGFSREELQQKATLLPEMGAIVHWYHYAATSLSVLEGLAVLNFAAEGQNVDIGGYRGGAGLSGEIQKKLYNLSDEALTFSRVHAYADADHCAIGARALARYAVSDEQKKRIRAAIAMTFDMWQGQARMYERPLADCWRFGGGRFYL